MSPYNAEKYCVILSCPFGWAGTSAASDRIKLFLFKSCVVQRHSDASTYQGSLMFALRISVAALSDFTTSNLVCRVEMKATNIRLIDDMRNRGTLRASESGRKSGRPFCRRQRRSKAVRELPHKIKVTLPHSEQNSGAYSDNSA